MPSTSGDFDVDRCWRSLKEQSCGSKGSDGSAKVLAQIHKENSNRLNTVEKKQQTYANFLSLKKKTDNCEGARTDEVALDSCTQHLSYLHHNHEIAGHIASHERQQLLQRVQDDRLLERKEGLLKLTAVLRQGMLNNDAQHVKEVSKVLLRRLDDPADKCRELAAVALLQLTQVYCQHVPDIMPYMWPILLERLVRDKSCDKGPPEPAEEVRLKLWHQINAVVNVLRQDFSPCLETFVAAVECGCGDSCPEVVLAVCEAVRSVAENVGLPCWRVSKPLLVHLVPLTAHRRHKVRVSALCCVRVLMHFGAHEIILELTGFADPHYIPISAFYGEADVKVNWCGKLAADPQWQVRRELLVTIADWLTHLPERREHDCRLLPYLLNGCCDSFQEVAALAVKLLEQVGRQFEKEKGKELEDLVRYLPPEGHAVGWLPEGLLNKLYHLKLGSLPAGITQRACLGARLLLQYNFQYVVGALCADLVSWQDDVTKQACLALPYWIVHVEADVVNHLHHILPAIMKASWDKHCAPHLCCAALLLGAFSPLDKVMEVLTALFDVDERGVQQDPCDANFVQMLSQLITGAGLWCDNIREYASTLFSWSCDDVILSCDDISIKTHTLDLIGSLVDLICGDQTGSPCDSTNVMGCGPHGSTEISESGNSAMGSCLEAAEQADVGSGAGSLGLEMEGVVVKALLYLKHVDADKVERLLVCLSDGAGYPSPYHMTSRHSRHIIHDMTLMIGCPTDTEFSVIHSVWKALATAKQQDAWLEVVRVGLPCIHRRLLPGNTLSPEATHQLLDCLLVLRQQTDPWPQDHLHGTEVQHPNRDDSHTSIRSSFIREVIRDGVLLDVIIQLLCHAQSEVVLAGLGWVEIVIAPGSQSGDGTPDVLLQYKEDGTVGDTLCKLLESCGRSRHAGVQQKAQSLLEHLQQHLYYYKGYIGDDDIKD